MLTTSPTSSHRHHTFATTRPSDQTQQFSSNSPLHLSTLYDHLPSTSSSDLQGPFVTSSIGFDDSHPPTTTAALAHHDQYMSTGLFAPQNPAIRIQHPHAQAAAPHSAAWTHDGGYGPFAYNTSGTTTHTHHRASSNGSIGSASTPSYQYNTSGGQAPASYHDHSPPPSAAHKPDSYAFAADRSFAQHTTLPTPTHTPTSDSFAHRPHNMAAHLARQHDFDGEDELPAFSHSARHSVSSFGNNSPSTPHQVADDLDDAFKVPSHDLLRSGYEPHGAELFAGSSQAPLSSPQVRMQHGSQQFLSPYTKSPQLADLLSEASKRREHSPHTAGRPVSPHSHADYYSLQPSPFDRAHVRSQASQQQQQQQQQQQRMSQTAGDTERPKTISPKDVQLEYHETDDDHAKMPLFPDGADYAQSSYGNGHQFGADAGSYGLDTSRAQAWVPTPSTATVPQSAFSFLPPGGADNLHGLSFPAQAFPSSTHEPTPDFPAHLTSMESSISDAGFDSSQQTNGTPSGGEVQRPESTFADAGTYSCTYHGCTHRFDSPQKLQKHKREAHRPVVGPGVGAVQARASTSSRSTSPAIGSSMSSAALLARNSQAGPHRCDRVNPTTGKPCHTVFSRPYDLTRHEDTIHNGRKQKVRCALCVEEKSFSRNDALTRHMRVVHPEVDFPGKHRKRGGPE